MARQYPCTLEEKYTGFNEIRQHEFWATRPKRRAELERELERAFKVYQVVSGLGDTDSLTLPEFTKLVAELSQKEADQTAQKMVEKKITGLRKDVHYRVSDGGEISFTWLGVSVLLCSGVFDTSEEFVYRDMVMLITQITTDKIGRLGRKQA